MSRYTSHIEGPRWANIGEAIEVFGLRCDVEIKTVVTKGLLRERVDFAVTGSDEEIAYFKRWVRRSVQEYNK